MAFHLAAAAGANLNTNFPNVFRPTGAVAARGQAPRLVVPRNDSSSVPTINMFIDGESPSLRYAASIIDACVDETTYALRCTAPAYYDACGPYGVAATVTSGPATYRVSTAVVRGDAGATIQQSCDLQGTTQAVCSATVGFSGDGTTTATETTGTISGSTYYRFDVAITGGAEKTANPSAECKPAPTAGASMKAVAMWGLVGAVGVASLLGF